MVQRKDWLKQEFKEGDSYLVLRDSGDTTLQIIEVDIDNIEVRWADNNRGIFERNRFEARVNSGEFQKIEDEQKPEEQFKVGDLFRYVESPETIYSINSIKDDLVYSGWSNSVNGRSGANPPINIQKLKNDFLNGQAVLVKDSKPTNPEDEKPQGSYKVGDKFISSENKDLIFTIDFIKYSNIGTIYEDGLTGNLERKDFEKGLKSGYYKPYNDSQQETELYLKVGDKFKEKTTNKLYLIKSINKDKDFFDYALLNKKNQESTNYKNSILSLAQSKIKSGNWMLIDETKPTYKPTKPKTLSDKDKQIKHILDINIDDIDL